LLLSRINSLSMFYGVCLLLGMGMVGCMDTVPATVTINWFRKKASIAMGIMLCGPAVGGLLVPLVTRTIDTFDWRVAMVIFGTGAWVLLLPLSLLIRHRPEQYGYLPDGEEIKEHVIDEEGTPSQVNEVAIGLNQALKSRPFRHSALGLICHMCVINSVIVHVMPYLSSIGIARTTSSFIASSIPLISIAGRLSFGWLGDRLDKRRITTLGFAMLSLSMVCFGFSSAVGIWLIIPFLILFGIGYGGPIPVMLTLLREHFGRARFGSILGIIIGGALLAGMIGAPLAGWVFDSFGSYMCAWFGFAVITIVGMLSILTTPPSAKTG
jgi:MFS family permease